MGEVYGKLKIHTPSVCILLVVIVLDILLINKSNPGKLDDCSDDPTKYEGANRLKSRQYIAVLLGYEVDCTAQDQRA